MFVSLWLNECKDFVTQQDLTFVTKWYIRF